jgi:hypothetical protein
LFVDQTLYAPFAVTETTCVAGIVVAYPTYLSQHGKNNSMFLIEFLFHTSRQQHEASMIITAKHANTYPTIAPIEVAGSSVGRGNGL